MSDSHEQQTEFIQCPCCDYICIEQLGEICRVCYWEHNVKGMDDESPTEFISLRKARDNFVKYGMSQKHFVKIKPWKRRHRPPFQRLPREL